MKRVLAFFAFMLALALGAEGAFGITCYLGGTPIACPFDFSTSFYTPCVPSTTMNVTKVVLNSTPPGYSLDKAATYITRAGVNYSFFLRDNETLYFPLSNLQKSDFVTQVTVNGISGKAVSAANVSSCPCAIEKSSFSARMEDSSGREVLKGSLSGSQGCPTDGSTVYRILFFIVNNSNLAEIVRTTTKGDYFEITSVNAYSLEYPVALYTAVVDAASGKVYGLFQPDFIKPNDFSFKVAGGTNISVKGGVLDKISVNVTNLGTVTESFRAEISGLPTTWQYSSTNTKPLSPGESAVAQIEIIAPAGALPSEGRIVVSSLATLKTKYAGATFNAKSFATVSAELYSSAEGKIAIGAPFDVSVLVKVAGSAPLETAYWTTYPEPVTRLVRYPSGKAGLTATSTTGNSSYVEKAGCSGSPSLWKLSTVLEALYDRPEAFPQVSGYLLGFSNKTPVQKDVETFVAAKNRTQNSVLSLISKVSAAKEDGVSNCTKETGNFSLRVFLIDTVSYQANESGKITFTISGKESGVFLEALRENLSIPKGGSGNVILAMTNRLTAEKTVTLKSGQTSFKVTFPNGSAIRIPPLQTIEVPVTIADKGTISRKIVETVDIIGTTTDASGDLVSSVARINVTVRNAALEVLVALPATFKMEQGANKSFAVKLRNGGTDPGIFEFTSGAFGTVSPQTIELSPGEQSYVNLSVGMPMDATEGSRVKAGFTGRKQGTEEEITQQMEITVTTSPKTRLYREIAGMKEEAKNMEADCSFYNLGKLNSLIEAASTRLGKGEYNAANSIFSQAKTEFAVAEERCKKPDSTATLLIIGAIVAVAGGGYYYLKVRKGQKKTQVGFGGPYYQQQQQQQGSFGQRKFP